MTTDLDLVERLLRAPVDASAIDDGAAWWPVHDAATAGASSTIAAAALGGAAADRLAWAFSAGYRAALAALLPELGGLRVALCATERGGAHPRAIESTLTAAGDGAFTLRGEKRWTTMALGADALLVVARVAEGEAARPTLKVARVSVDAPGVTRTRMPDPPFCPEIDHAEVRFEDVRVEAGAVLAGDGYADVLKPFRTREDAHVLAAALGHVVGSTRRFSLDRGLAERALALLVSLERVALAPPLAWSTHVALAGVLALAPPLLLELATALDADHRAIADRLRRDAPLLGVASTARQKRAEGAWERALAGR